MPLPARRIGRLYSANKWVTFLVLSSRSATRRIREEAPPKEISKLHAVDPWRCDGGGNPAITSSSSSTHALRLLRIRATRCASSAQTHCHADEAGEARKGSHCFGAVHTAMPVSAGEWSAQAQQCLRPHCFGNATVGAAMALPECFEPDTERACSSNWYNKLQSTQSYYIDESKRGYRFWGFPSLYKVLASYDQTQEESFIQGFDDRSYRDFP